MLEKSSCKYVLSINWVCEKRNLGVSRNAISIEFGRPTEFSKRQSALRIIDLISLDEIRRIRDRVVDGTNLNCRFPPNSHVQPRKFDPWLLFESRRLIWHPNVRVVSFGPSSSSPESLLALRFQPSRSHLLLSFSRC